MTSEERGSEPPIVHQIICSVNTFLYSNYAWAVLSIGMVLYGVLGLILPGNANALFAPQVFEGMIGFGAFGLIAVMFGISGQKMKVELLFLIYIFILSLGIVAQAVSFLFFIFYTSDAGTIVQLKEPTVGADTVFFNHLKDLAGDDADIWKKTQDHFDCCGIEFELRIDDESFVDTAETGDRCAEGEAAITALEASLDVDINDASKFDQFGNYIPALEDATVGKDELFFCKFAISDKLKSNVPTVAIFSALIMLVEISCLVSASRLYWVPEFLGGWQFDEEDLNEVAERKGLKMPEKDQQNNRVLSALRGQASRISFRIKNAVTADPSIPQSAGFLGRLSMNRNALSGAGSFRGAAMVDAVNQANAMNDLNDQMDTHGNQNYNSNTMQSRTFISRMSQPFGRGSKSPPGMPPRPDSQKSKPPGMSARARVSQRLGFGSPFGKPLPPSTLQTGDGTEVNGIDDPDNYRKTMKSESPPPGLNF